MMENSIYPQYDYINHSVKVQHSYLKVNVTAVSSQLNVKISPLCKINKNDDYELFLVQEKLFVLSDGVSFKVLKAH